MPKLSLRNVLTIAVLMLTLPWMQTLALLAQQPATHSDTQHDWARVQALRMGTHLTVKQGKTKTDCMFRSADADAINCGGQAANQPGLVLQRSAITSVRVSHRGRSTLIGATPGLVLMTATAIGGSAASCSGKDLFCGFGTAALFLLGVMIAIVGVPIGYFTDFTGSVIYKKS
jgi:hypothetical protein